ncbi:MAG: zinc metallopeptidase [Phycisphaeraceae bacterium]|nr:zinc metallopeptidase [Phycisphaeraceae bacterium]
MMLYLLLLIGPVVLALWAQARVKSAYARAGAMAARSGLSGAEVARMILDSHGVRGVGIEPAHGFMTDHYDPRHKMLRLSEEVYSGRSVAALGIAAHEAGHALQDAQKYPLMAVRNAAVPMAMVGSQAGLLIALAGLVLGGAAAIANNVHSGFGFWMFITGIVLFTFVVLFQLVNLPVEFDASNRAKSLLQSTGIVAQGDEAKAMNRVLNAAAMTYVAATISAIATLLYYLLASGLLGRRD